MILRPPRALSRQLVAAGAVAFAILLARALAGQNAPANALTLLSRDGRRTIPVATVGEQEFVALDDLASTFQLSVHEESGAVTVTYKGRTIILTPEQALASVGGRLASIAAPPVRQGRHWLVPLDFISRALSLVYDAKLDLRRQSHLLVIGDLRVPRVIMRYESQPASARVTIDAAPRATSTVTQETGHLTVRFDADALDLVPFPPAVPQGLITAFRQVDATTIAIDVTPRMTAFRSTATPIDPAMRVVIELTGAQTEALQPGISQPPAIPPPPPELPPGIATPVSAVRTIAIDAGHGGEDEGTHAADGTKEKDLVLAIARRVKAAIEGRLGIRVLMTRDDDRNVPLEERSAIANNNKADLLISLHANASWRPSATGAAIYYASFDRAAEQASHAFSAAERLPTFGGGMRDIDLVPWDLAQTRYVERSEDLARVIEQQCKDRVPLAPRSLDRAPLRVLEAANMPAVLVELGFLSNESQARQLNSPEFQATITQVLADAVVRYRDAIAAPGGTR